MEPELELLWPVLTVSSPVIKAGERVLSQASEQMSKRFYTCVVHHLVPALLLPGAIPGVFSGLKVFVGCPQNTGQHTRHAQRRNNRLVCV